MSNNISPDQLPVNQSTFSSFPDSAQELLSQALALHSENRLDEAAAFYREVLDVVPEHIQACFNLGAIFHGVGDLPGAISLYRVVLSNEPDNFQALYLLANALREEGAIDEALINYQRAIKVNHTYPEAHYNLGILYYHQGVYDQAMACYREVIKIEPTHADSLYNIGIIHFEQGDYDKAAASYEQALVARPDDVDILFNLAFTRAKQGQFEQAALHYHEAIELDPNDAELHNSLGSILRKINEPEMAEVCYRQAVGLRPDYGSAWTNLATILQILEKYEEALECYSKAIEFGDHTESADFMMAALTGSTRSTSPQSYVRDLYDNYAENFEKSLVGNLDYKAPELLKKLCISQVGKNRRFRSAADLGCGTGLAGEQFRNIVDHLAGVDLSEKMLAKAEARAIYDHLYCSDIVDYLEGEAKLDFDLVIAADVFIYLGELTSFFKSVRRLIEPGGYLFFSTEKLDSGRDFSLLKTGRYAHSEVYIRALAAEFGFRVEVCKEVKLRKEKDNWLPGYVFALYRTG